MGNEEVAQQLAAELRDLSDRHPKLKDHELFTAWFILAYITGEESAAIGAVVGGARDKSVDGIYVDDHGKTVVIVQSKYRENGVRKWEARNDVLGFAELADIICDRDKERFREFSKTTDQYVADRLLEARSKVTKSGYKIRLYFVTSASCSKDLYRDATQIIRRADGDAVLDIVDGSRLGLLLRDYLDGAAPPVPSVDLDMETGANIKVNGVLQRYDNQNKIESWVFSMAGSAIAELVEATGPRLFARNIRGFVGTGTPVNRGIEATLRKEPDHFFYYNNGITIVCDRAEKLSRKGRDVLRVSNPQIINGQQTSRMLSELADYALKASVLVKVIQVPRLPNDPSEEFDVLVSRIVGATNYQNAIRPSDLMANDRRQIEIERELRKVGYVYLRKRQTKAEARRLAHGRRTHLIKKEELAQAVAGCELDPVVARSGKDNLFQEQHYTSVFPTSDARYYLTRYSLFQQVSAWSRGYSQRGYVKWLVLGFVWSRLRLMLRGTRQQETFCTLLDKNRTELCTPLGRSIDAAFTAAIRYYNASRGKGERTIDISLFFRSKRGRHREFEVFWETVHISLRERFERGLAKVAVALEQ